MENRIIIKLLIFSGFIILWLYFSIKGIKSKEENFEKKWTFNDIVRQLKINWYDLLFLIGVSGIVNIFVRTNTLYSILLGIAIVIVLRIIKLIFLI